MKTKTQSPAAMLEPTGMRAARIIGVGSAGVSLLEAMNREEFTGASFVAVNTDATSLAGSTVALKIHLETKLLRGLGTGGDPERGQGDVGQGSHFGRAVVRGRKRSGAWARTRASHPRRAPRGTSSGPNRRRGPPG